MMRSEADWMREYEHRGALWFHDGNPKRPHVRLHKGKHSDGFFNSELVMEDPVFLDSACSEFVALLKISGFDIHTVDRVVGPSIGAITLANDISRNIAMRTGQCLRAYTEKEGDGANMKMVFKKTRVIPGEHVLLCEDVVTTGDSVELTARAIADSGGIVFPLVVVLVNRSGAVELNGRNIIALIDKKMNDWEPGECELCRLGSEALYPPKATENWKRLHADY